jgi:hypothetical protein
MSDEQELVAQTSAFEVCGISVADGGSQVCGCGIARQPPPCNRNNRKSRRPAKTAGLHCNTVKSCFSDNIFSVDRLGAA